MINYLRRALRNWLGITDLALDQGQWLNYHGRLITDLTERIKQPNKTLVTELNHQMDAIIDLRTSTEELHEYLDALLVHLNLEIRKTPERLLVSKMKRRTS